MSKETNNPQIVIDDKEYDFNSMTDQQKILVNHVADLDRKIGSAEFNLEVESNSYTIFAWFSGKY